MIDDYVLNCIVRNKDKKEELKIDRRRIKGKMKMI
jgi:hypothetical protein